MILPNSTLLAPKNFSNNNNNNNDNNININNFMEMTGGRHLTMGSLYDVITAANNETLEKIQETLQKEPGCKRIVICDLMSLVKTNKHFSSLSKYLPDQNCNNHDTCSLLP